MTARAPSDQAARPPTTVSIAQSAQRRSFPGTPLDLLQALSTLHVLATSREPLRTAGERVVRLETLAAPSGDGPISVNSSRAGFPKILLISRKRRGQCEEARRLNSPLTLGKNKWPEPGSRIDALSGVFCLPRCFACAGPPQKRSLHVRAARSSRRQSEHQVDCRASSCSNERRPTNRQ